MSTINSSDNITKQTKVSAKATGSKTPRKPNLFVVGAAKSGTTTLWYYFKNHPQIYVPENRLYKEPGYFSKLGNLGKFTRKTYLNLFKDATDEHKYVGEASHAYLSDPQVAKRLYEFNPDARIIIILRNPADRAYSLYNWMRQEGYEWAGSFEQALKLEGWRKKQKIPNPLHPQYYYNYLYFDSGLYSKQVERYFKVFGEKQTLVLTFDELKDKPEQTLKTICEFLEVDPITKLPAVVNKSKKAYSAKFQFLLRMSVSTRSLFNKHILRKKPLNKIQRDKLLQIGITEEKPPPLHAATRKKLRNRYQKDIERLSKITHKDLKKWIK